MFKSPRNCILDTLLKECYARPHRRCSQHRNLHIEVSPSQRALRRDDVQNIAILGGGITGLAAADYLTFTQPNARITLYESGPRLGGWLRSTSVDVGTGKVIFEQGPRTLRPNFPAAWETLSMVSFGTTDPF
jgi:oxygen-dependent protoporphyrinogen oxidase